MPIARHLILDSEEPGCYHLISRCVRRAFLCGDGYEHRRQWVEDRLKVYAKSFAIDIFGYAVMSNHLHLVIRNRPDLAKQWDQRDVVGRWATLFPKRGGEGQARDWTELEVQKEINCPGRIQELRTRLASPSWLMKLLKERISRQANHEDDCTGAFWEGRFKSIALLDQQALIAAMAYVDLNPVRANIAKSLEKSDFTSIKDRIAARREGKSDSPWLVPLSECYIGDPLANATFSLDRYLQLVDLTGRAIAPGKDGSIPEELAPILERLDIESTTWCATMRGRTPTLGTAIGNAIARAKEALRRGVNRIVDKARFYRPEPISG